MTGQPLVLLLLDDPPLPYSQSQRRACMQAPSHSPSTAAMPGLWAEGAACLCSPSETQNSHGQTCLSPASIWSFTGGKRGRSQAASQLADLMLCG